MSKDYCWMFGDHKGNPCPCGYPNAEDREIIALCKQLEDMKHFHPRAMKLMKKKKPFVVVANDEPYYLDVYYVIRKREISLGRWTKEDELMYQSEIERIGAGGQDKPDNRA